jgi:flagellar biogenesis protein FliO
MTGELVRMVAGLGVVAACLWALGRLARRRGGFPVGGPRSGPLQVISRQPLAKGVSLVAVRVGGPDHPGRVLLLGVGSTGVSKIAEMDADALSIPGDGSQVILPAYGRSPLRGLVAGTLQGGQRTASFLRGERPGVAWTSNRLDRLRELTVRRG